MDFITIVILTLFSLKSAECQCENLNLCLQDLLKSIFPDFKAAGSIKRVNSTEDTSDAVKISVFENNGNKTNTSDPLVKTFLFEINPDELENDPQNNSSNIEKVVDTKINLEKILSNLAKAFNLDEMNNNDDLTFLDYALDNNSTDVPTIDVELHQNFNTSGLYGFDPVNVSSLLKRAYEVQYVETVMNKSGDVFSDIVFTMKAIKVDCFEFLLNFTHPISSAVTNENADATKLNDTTVSIKVTNTSAPVVLTIRGKQGLDFPRLQTFKINEEAVCDVDDTTTVTAIPNETIVTTDVYTDATTFEPLKDTDIPFTVLPLDTLLNSTLDAIVPILTNASINATDSINTLIANVTSAAKPITSFINTTLDGPIPLDVLINTTLDSVPVSSIVENATSSVVPIGTLISNTTYDAVGNVTNAFKDVVKGIVANVTASG